MALSKAQLEGIKKHRLSPEKNEAIFKAEIEPKALAQSQETEEGEKWAFVLGGQMGVGKSTIAKIAERMLLQLSKKGWIKVDADELRQNHPNIEELKAAQDPDLGTYTHADASTWVGKLLESAQKHNRNLLYDTSLRDAVWDTETAIDLKKRGYKVQVMIVAGNKNVSRLGNAYRFVKNVFTKDPDRRLAPIKLQDLGYKGLVETLDELEKQNAADKISLYSREGKLLFESTLQTNGTWKREYSPEVAIEPERKEIESFGQVLKTIRNSPFTDEQHETHMKFANEARAMLATLEFTDDKRAEVEDFLRYSKIVNLVDELSHDHDHQSSLAVPGQAAQEQSPDIDREAKQVELLSLVRKPALSTRVMKVSVEIAVLEKDIEDVIEKIANLEEIVGDPGLHKDKDLGKLREDLDRSKEYKKLYELRLKVRNEKLRNLLKIPEASKRYTDPLGGAVTLDKVVEMMAAVLRNKPRRDLIGDRAAANQVMAEEFHLVTLLDGNERKQIHYPFPPKIQQNLNRQLGLINTTKLSSRAASILTARSTATAGSGVAATTFIDERHGYAVPTEPTDLPHDFPGTPPMRSVTGTPLINPYGESPSRASPSPRKTNLSLELQLPSAAESVGEITNQPSSKQPIVTSGTLATASTPEPLIPTVKRSTTHHEEELLSFGAGDSELPTSLKAASPATLMPEVTTVPSSSVITTTAAGPTPAITSELTPEVPWNFTHLSLPRGDPNRQAQINKLTTARDSGTLTSQAVSTTEKESFNKGTNPQLTCFLDVQGDNLRFAKYDWANRNQPPTIVTIPANQQVNIPKALKNAIRNGELDRGRINGNTPNLQMGDIFSFSTHVPLKNRVPEGVKKARTKFGC